MEKDFWDNRYGNEAYTYGVEPNAFVKEKLQVFEPGKVLLPADGEGRNSVFAAQLGWDVHAFDFSVKGKEKADKLAAQHGVKINYEIHQFLKESYPPASFDAIVLTFVHFDPSVKTEMHQRLDSYLKPGGVIILEAYSKEHREINKLNPNIGGPPDANMMYALEEIEKDFEHYEKIELSKQMVHLSEGSGHNGDSSVIRFIGRKKGL